GRGPAGPADRVVAIGPGLDTTRFHPDVSGAGVRAELGLHGPAVGLVANIRGSKGHAYFLEAARVVLRTRPDTTFLIVGDGIGFDDVRRRVKEMDLDSHVIMTGFRRDVPEIMPALDVLVLPSIRSAAMAPVITQPLAAAARLAGVSAVGRAALLLFRSCTATVGLREARFEGTMKVASNDPVSSTFASVTAVPASPELFLSMTSTTAPGSNPKPETATFV